MSGGLDVLALDEGDVTKMLVAATHIGTKHTFWLKTQVVTERFFCTEFKETSGLFFLSSET